MFDMEGTSSAKENINTQFKHFNGKTKKNKAIFFLKELKNDLIKFSAFFLATIGLLGKNTSF